jgi:hypothetical protein
MPKRPVGKVISNGFERGEAHFIKKFPALSPYVVSQVIQYAKCQAPYGDSAHPSASTV